MAKEMKSTERKEQIAFINWANACYLLKPYDFYHIPNEGKRSPKTGAILKMMGFKKGIVDVHIAKRVTPYNSLWIEFKSPEDSLSKSGKLSDEQIDFLFYRLTQQDAVAVCYNSQQAINVTIAYLKGLYNHDYINNEKIKGLYQAYLQS